MSAAFPSVALVRRELLSMLRGPRAFGLLLLFAVGAAALSIFNWPEATEYRRGPWAAFEQNVLAVYFMGLLFVGTVLCVPAFAAGAIVLERERGTFDFLRMSLARPVGVLFSKLTNAVGFFFLLMLGIAPIVATVLMLPGVDRIQLSAAFALIAATATSCAAVGLLCSSMVRRSLAAIALSYVGVAAAWFLPMVLMFIAFAAYALFFDVRSVGGAIEFIFNVTVPFAGLGSIFSDGVDTWLLYSVGYQLLAASVCLLVAHRRLLRPMDPPKVELRKPLDDQKVIRERRTTWPYYLVDPLRRKKPIEDRRNPMLVREIRWGLLNRGTILIRLFYVAATIYFFAGIVASMDDARSYRSMEAWMMTQIVLTVLVTPALTSNAITKELELGNLDMLRITLLRPRDIVMGKYAAATFTLVPLFCASLVALVPTAILVRPDWQPIAMGYGTLCVSAALALSISIFFSTALRRTLPAIVCSYVGTVFALFGLQWVGAWQAWNIIEAARSDPNPPMHLLDYSDLLSPISSFRSALEQFDSNDGYSNARIGYWAMGSGAWLGIAVLILVFATILFSSKRMRDP